MRKSQKKLVVGFTILLLLGFAAYSFIPQVQQFFAGLGEKPMVSIANFYDKNGNKISTPLAIVNNIEAVYALDFDVNLKSLSSVPLTISFSGTPSPFNSAVSLPSFVLSPNQTKTVRSNRMNVSPLGVGDIPLVLTARGSYVYGGQSYELLKTGSITLNIKPDPVADFTVSLSGQSATPSGITADYIISRGLSIDLSGITQVGTGYATGERVNFFARLNNTPIDFIYDPAKTISSEGKGCSQLIDAYSKNYVSCEHKYTYCDYCDWSITVGGSIPIPTTQAVGVYTLQVGPNSYVVAVQ